MAKRKLKRRGFTKIVFLSILLITAIILISGKFKSRETCGKWLFYKEIDKPVTDFSSAVIVLKEAVKGEKHYRDWPIPEDEAGFMKIYNLVPFIEDKEVRTKRGVFEEKKVWDMLLALAIDEQGNVYRYNDCFIW